MAGLDSDEQHLQALFSGFDMLLSQIEFLVGRNNLLQQELQKYGIGFEFGYDETIVGVATGALDRDHPTIRRALIALEALRKRIKQQNSDISELGQEGGGESSHLHQELPEGHPAVKNGSVRMACPFAAASSAHRSEHQSAKTASLPRRPDSLPTPPETKGHFIDEAPDMTAEGHSPPPSNLGSVSKCPIRMLDEKPPEEIAEYFETHKHEIPRSHEICVKRYQSNTQSIRQLDAKYGSLVNMIQGLGLTHQPMLPAKGEEKQASAKPVSNSSLEAWADKVGRGEEDTSSDDVEDRSGHFDRPLRDVRLGESPSRPWGISVPINEPTADTTPEDVNDKVSEPQEKPRSGETKAETDSAPHGSVVPNKELAPRMVFTGPVFIGYPPEQAALLIRHMGGNEQGIST